MSDSAALPLIIQGGMGVGVSDWRLARAVSMEGQLGVVSGTGVDTVLVRRLQDGDLGGHMRRAMAAFPVPAVVEQVLERYFRPEGRNGDAYAYVPVYRKAANRFRDQVTTLANFVEVYLAREGHDGPVGINLLTKIQLPTLPSLYGAVLAGVDYVIMGAGIPKDIPGVLDQLSKNLATSLRVDIAGSADPDQDVMEFDPAVIGDLSGEERKRPRFLPIIASNLLATMLTRRSNGKIDGFVIEGPTAGGHNAPPRGKTVYNERGEPVYGSRDVVNLDKIREMGLPFWTAGGTGTPEGLQQAIEAGAAGVQVGTPFAFCEESGITAEFKRRVLEQVASGTVDVMTDDKASPTGFPFKVVELSGSLSDPEVYAGRERTCDLGYLREAVAREDGGVTYRCPAEAGEAYELKGGDPANMEGRKCLCNALMANIGLAQVREDGVQEPPMLTSGDGLVELGGFLAGRSSYSARDVINYLLGR